MLQQGEIQLIKSQVRVCSNDKCDCVREGGGGWGGGGMLNEPGKNQEGKQNRQEEFSAVGNEHKTIFHLSPGITDTQAWQREPLTQ